MKSGNIAKFAALAACATAMSLVVCVGSAFAATVHGADFYGSGSALESGEIDVLNVDGSAGETVFLSVKSAGTALAKNLPYTIGENASSGDVASYAGVATLDIDGLDLNALDGTYTIEAYADRMGKELLYSGAIYGVYADLPDGSSKLIGTRTANDQEAATRTFQPIETLYYDGRTYRLSGQAAANGGTLHFAYQAYDESKTIDGVVKYVDATGATVATTKIPGLASGERRTVNIPSVITADNGDVYRTVFFRDSVTAINPTNTSFSIYCTKMSAADQALAGYYVATIQMVDGTGHVIATDSVNVTGEFIYTAPSVIYKTETVNAATGETAVVTYQISQSPTLRFSAANDGVLNRQRTVTVSYAAQPLDSTEVTVTFNYLDGSKRVNEEGRLLGSAQVLADDANPTVQPPSTIQANDTMYYLAGDPSDYAYTIHSGVVPSVDVYYVPDGYEAPEAYDVLVNYVNFATGETIETHSYTSDAGENARIIIDTPETFSADGVDYVRLAGQEGSIAHGYYSGIGAYTVYYRDVNDELSAGIVINTIRVVYESTTANSSITEEGASAAEGAEGTQGAQLLQLNSGRTYNVMDGDGGNASLTNESGVDSNSERIEDSETPLASGFDRGASSSAASSLFQVSNWMIPAGIALAVFVIAAIALIVLRRRNEDDDLYEM